MDQKKRTLRRLGIAGVATAMTTFGTPAIASAATLGITPHTVRSDISTPGAPTALKATDAGLDTVTLSWTAPSGTVSGYNVYMSTASGGEAGTTPVNNNVLVKGTTYTVTTPNPGTFYFQVAAVNPAGEGSFSSEASSAAAAVKPGAPASVAATAGDGAVQVSWKAPSSGGTPTSYTVDYGTSSSSLTSQRIVSGSTTSVVVGGLTNGTAYFFDVTATNSAGTGTASSTVSATPSTSTAPLPPTLSVSGTSSGQIDLSWTKQTNASGYNVYEGTSSGGESSTPINGSVPVSGNTLTVSAPNGTTEYFVVKAVNSVGSSAASNEVHATAGVTVVSAAPSAPQNVTGTIVGPTAVKLTWSAPASSGSSKVVNYEVFENGGTASVAHTSGTSTIVTGLTTSTSYSFTVAAQNAASANASTATFGPVSSAVKEKPLTSSSVIPQAPTLTSVSTVNTAAVSSSNPEANTIKWSAPKYPSSGYHFLVKRDGVAIANVASTSTTFKDSGAATSKLSTDSAPAAGTTYSYKVTEVSNTSGTATSGGAKIDTGAPTPGSPTSLTATETSTKGTVNLKWTAPTDLGAGNVTYDVLENGTAAPSADVTLGVHTDTATVSGVSSTSSTSFTVETQARNGAGADIGAPSAPSNASSVVAAKAVSTAAAPTGLTAAATSPTSVKLQWNASSTNGFTAASNYEIFKATSKSGLSSATPMKIDTSTSFTQTGLTAGTTYYFEVEALPAASPPVYSNVASATTTTSKVVTAPGAPTGVKAVDDGGLVNLSWTAPSSSGGSAISGYQVYETTSASSAGAKLLGSTSGTGTTASVDDLTAGTPVYLWVKAMNSSGQTSGLSQAVEVTPSSSTTKPSAPSTPQVSGGTDGTVFVVWSAPSSTGGSPIEGYFVTAHLIRGKGKTVFVRGTSARVTGLMTGRYYFTVVAKNVIGGGTPSAPSSIIGVSAVSVATKVYMTPPVALMHPGDVVIRVTTNKPGAAIHLFDEAYGTTRFFQKAIKPAAAARFGNGVAEFVVHIDKTNHFYAMVDGVKSNVVAAVVK